MFWFVLLATCCCTILGQDAVEPKIVLDAEDYRGFPEHFQHLIVDANHATDFTYRWHHNGKLIDDKYKLPFIGQLSRVLRISDQGTKKEYAGTYQFFMDTPVGSIAGRNVSVDFTYVGEFYDPKASDVRDVVVGQAAFITCPKHRPGNNFIYKWGKTSGAGGTKFVDSASNYIVLDNGTLFFSYLKNKDVAYINDLDVKCGMEANVGKDNRFTWSHVVNLKNQSKNFTKFGPEIVTKLPVKKFTVGETIYLKCAATGNPVPSYSWKVIDTEENEKPLVDGENDIYFADADPRILEIKPTKKSHAGKYVCTATIGQKSDSTQGELIYEEEPDWINGEKIKSVRPSIYSSHSWQCNATGSPTPTYTWYWNGKELKDSSTHNINGGSISFPSLLKENTGMYECVAHNRLNNIYQTAFLDVQAEKPTFDENSRNTTLFLNSQGTIKCHANAAPVATNTWTKDGVNIGATLSQYKVINNQDLVITRVSKSDIGKYTCTAKNVYGKDTMTILVKVIGEITFISAPKNSTVDLGKTLKLNCEAKDEAKDKITIKYKWRFNKKDLMIGADVYWSLTSKTLIILNAQVNQSGTYECIAYIDSPSYAEKKRSAKVIVRGPPSEIDTVKVEGDCSNLEAKLTWSVIDNYDPIKYFTMEWRTSYEMYEWHTHADSLPANRSEFLFKPLSPYAKYSFRILGVNSIGTSTNLYHTEFKHCTTPARVPTKCPQPKGFAGGDGVLTFKWEKMKLIEQNGNNFNYLVQYKAGGRSWLNKTLIGVTESFVVPNAGYYQWWEFQIRGANEKGSGPVCSSKAFSGQDAPNIPPARFRATPNTDYVTLDWEPMVLTEGNVDGYMLKYWQKGGSSAKRRRSPNSNVCDVKNPCTEDIVGAGTTTIKVDGLAPIQTYIMELWGYNSGGSGPKSSLNVTTNEGLPGPPDNVVFVVYARFIEVRWRAPLSPNGIIIGYTVSKLPKMVVEVGEDVTRYIFTGLKPDQSYTLSVRARTKEGRGGEVQRTVKTHKDSVPAKPKPPLAKGTGENDVNVTFREGTPTRGFPKSFVAVYRVKGDLEEKRSDSYPLFGEKSQRTIVIPGLDVTKEYEFATIASNVFGESTQSEYNSTVPGAGPVTYARSSPVYKRSWFVALIVIVCVLLIILIIALLVTRKRGERYPVGKREKKRAGILDNAEEAEPDTYPMKPNRNAGNGTNKNGSKASMPTRDPDGDSLDEYGEDRFGEDAGSLIGEYNDDTKKRSAVEGPEFV